MPARARQHSRKLRSRLQDLRRFAFFVFAAIVVVQLGKRRSALDAATRGPIPRPGPGINAYLPPALADSALANNANGAGGQDQGHGHANGQDNNQQDNPKLTELDCPDDKGIHRLRIHSLDLTDEIIYQRRCVRTHWSWDVDRDLIVHSNSPLLRPAKSVHLSLNSCHVNTPISCDPINLWVPPPQLLRPHAEFLFGIASTYDRIVASLPYFAHWLSNSHARLVVIVADADSHDLVPLTALYLAAAIDAVLLSPSPAIQGLNVNQLHFTMIADMVNYVTASTRWLGVIDDDTFVPSLDNLANALADMDPTHAWYVGVLSDSQPQVDFWGFMAFGGAGIFISAPLARQLEPLVESCLRNSQRFKVIGTGDALLKDCIYENTPTRLTVLPGLNQLDRKGDLSGFFEADPRPLLTLHHWKSWYHEPVDHMAAASRWCGDCFLQRWTFGRDTVLTNGYSISVYAQGIKGLDLSKTEATWDSADQAVYNSSFGPLRRKMTPAEKKQYKLAHSGLLPDGSFAQTYVHRHSDEAGGLDEVVELMWQP